LFLLPLIKRLAREMFLVNFLFTAGVCTKNQKISNDIPITKSGSKDSIVGEKFKRKSFAFQRSFKKILCDSCWLQPESSAFRESYFPARIPWFFSGKINR
jgi:hypothetical protein